MQNIQIPEIVDRISREIISISYGVVDDFKINEIFEIPEKGSKTGWDVQVNFILDDLKYTVDMEIQNNGHVTSTRLIDTMTPL